MSEVHTVFIVGATGKTGQSIVNVLLDDPKFVSDFLLVKSLGIFPNRFRIFSALLLLYARFLLQSRKSMI